MCAESIVADVLAHHAREPGSKPRSALWVEPCSLRDIKPFVEREHYSHSLHGVTASYCFRVLEGDTIVGAALFGLPSGAGVLTKYSEKGRFRLVELRRFVLSEHLPKNSESRLLGIMLRLLKKEGVTRILTYADPAQGHTGTIYRATGFAFKGRTSPRKKIAWRGKEYPDRNLHQTNFPFHKELRAAVASGEATTRPIPGKFIFTRDL